MGEEGIWQVNDIKKSHKGSFIVIPKPPPLAVVIVP